MPEGVIKTPSYGVVKRKLYSGEKKVRRSSRHLWVEM